MAEWNSANAQWLVRTRDLRTGVTKEVTAHVLVNASGYLNNWTWPNISGLHSFRGSLVHSAAWDHAIDLSGKVVGVIGNG